MKKKTVIIIAVIAILAVVVLGGVKLIGALSGQASGGSKTDAIEAFVKDSSYVFSGELPTAKDKVEWDSILSADLEDRISAVTYAARNEFALDTQDDAYIISSEELISEKVNLFNDPSNQEFTDSQLLTSTDNGYLLHLKDVQDSGLTYEIVETSIGLKGSEPTRVTVLYTLNGRQCELEYVLTDDKESPYRYKVVDIEYCGEE